MRRIRAKGTRPEILVRSLLRQLGFIGYRLHRNELPGKPDICFVGRKLAIQVHGCFWHAHNCDEGVRKPKSNRTYWTPKLLGNRARDARNSCALKEAGWQLLTVWECELADTVKVANRLKCFLARE